MRISAAVTAASGRTRKGTLSIAQIKLTKRTNEPSRHILLTDCNIPFPILPVTCERMSFERTILTKAHTLCTGVYFGHHMRKTICAFAREQALGGRKNGELLQFERTAQETPNRSRNIRFCQERYRASGASPDFNWMRS